MISWVTAANVADCSVRQRHSDPLTTPLDCGGRREVPGVRESCHHHDVTRTDLAVADRRLEVDRDRNGKQVATLGGTCRGDARAKSPVPHSSCAAAADWADW